MRNKATVRALCLILVSSTCIHAFPLERRGDNRYVAALKLFGTPECAYTTDVIVGGVEMSLIVDTGSSHLAVASTGCTGCESVLTPLYPNTDLTGAAVKVTYGMHGFASWWSGVFTNALVKFPVDQTGDATYMGPPLTTGVTTKIAAIQSSSNFFIASCPFAQGIWGQAYRGITGSLDYTLIDNLAVAGVPEGFALEICQRDPTLPGQPETERNPNNKTGNLWLGGLDGSHVSGPFQYMSIVAQTWYQINLESFVINGAPISGLLPLSSSKAIVDSGTTDVVISDENFATITAAMRASKMLVFSSAIADTYVNAFWDQTYILKIPNTEFTFNSTVTFGVVIDGKRFDMNLQNFIYVVPDTTKNGWSTLSFSGISGGGPQSSSSSVGSILGIPFMMGKVVFFDRAPRADYPLGRIGVANSQNCYDTTDAASINIFAAVNATSPYSILDSTSNSGAANDISGKRTSTVILLWTSIVLSLF